MHRCAFLLWLPWSAAAAGQGRAKDAAEHVKRSAPELPDTWEVEKTREVSRSHVVPLRFVLRQQNLDDLEGKLRSVSDPTSPSYGKYVSAEAARKLIAPSAEDAKSVERWLDSASLSWTRIGTDIIEAKVHVDKAEDLLRTTFKRVMDHDSGQHTYRAGDIYLPADVNSAVVGVFGLYGLPLPRIKKKKQTSEVQVTPEVLASTYGKEIGQVQVSRDANVQAVAGFVGQQVDPQDLVQFFDRYVPSATEDDAKVSKFVGDGVGPAGGEASLDIQYIMGTAPGIKTEFWYFGGPDFCADIKNWTAYILDQTVAPLVHSVSYGWQGDLSSVGCPEELVESIDRDFALIALRGITLVMSSGDSGSGWAPPSCSAATSKAQTGVKGTSTGSTTALQSIHCCGLANARGAEAWAYTDSTKICEFFSSVSDTFSASGVTAGGDLVVPRQQKLWPNWPASSPHVTAVGSTTFTKGIGSEEEATTVFGTGGGFSWLSKIPCWQEKAVKGYGVEAKEQPPTSYTPPKGSYPSSGRGTPDVSLLGEGYQVIVNGEVSRADGTSASAPVFAAMVGILNAHRLEKGHPPMGFLNPFLYQTADATKDVFTDINLGNNAIGGWGESLKYGYDCAPGWDPVTGLGTPKLPQLVEAALSVVDGKPFEQVI